MAVNPVGQILAQRRSRKRVGAGAENSHEDRCRRGLSGGPIMDRDRVAGPIDEGFLSRLMIMPKHHVAVPVPPLIQLIKTAVTVAVRVRFPILLPEQLQREMFVSLKLGLQRAKI